MYLDDTNQTNPDILQKQRYTSHLAELKKQNKTCILKNQLKRTELELRKSLNQDEMRHKIPSLLNKKDYLERPHKNLGFFNIKK